MERPIHRSRSTHFFKLTSPFSDESCDSLWYPPEQQHPLFPPVKIGPRRIFWHGPLTLREPLKLRNATIEFSEIQSARDISYEIPQPLKQKNNIRKFSVDLFNKKGDGKKFTKKLSRPPRMVLYSKKCELIKNEVDEEILEKEEKPSLKKEKRILVSAPKILISKRRSNSFSAISVTSFKKPKSSQS